MVDLDFLKIPNADGRDETLLGELGKGERLLFWKTQGHRGGLHHAQRWGQKYVDIHELRDMKTREMRSETCFLS